MYNGNMTFAALKQLMESQSTLCHSTTATGRAVYDKFMSFAGARDDATIAASFGPGESVTAGQIADIRAAAQTYLEMDNFARNIAITQGDRMFSWNKFR